MTTLALTAAVAYAPSGSAALVNGTFEADDASGGDLPFMTGWINFNGSFTNSTIGPNSGPVSHDAGGTQSAKTFGADGGLLQQITAAAGDTVVASVWAMNWQPDTFTQFGFMELSFRDAGNNVLPGSQFAYVDPIDDGTNIFLPPQDGADISDWTQLTVSAFAPEGTATAQILLIHQIVAAGGGSLFWDDASLTATAPAVPVPAAVWLFGSGILGLVGVARRKSKR